jgi:hypothetical protein
MDSNLDMFMPQNKIDVKTHKIKPIFKCNRQYGQGKIDKKKWIVKKIKIVWTQERQW